MKSFKIISLALSALFLVSACKTDKKVTESMASMEARIAALEKIVTPPKEEPEVQKAAYDVPVGQSFVLGNKDAKINVAVFSNFQCPYCSRADQKLRELLKDPELKDKINISFKHFPFERHVEARNASKAALAVGEQGSDKFWAMVEKIFGHQDSLNAANYAKWAKEVGADTAKYKADLAANDKKYDEIINADIKMGSEKAQLRGTPWTLVNGWLIEGDITADTVKKMIKEKNL